MMMKEGVEESYRLKANMIRQEAKIKEQLKSIELDRLKRIGKNVKAANKRREYCTMCDLRFHGHLSQHRRTEGHLNLKKFLHPRCNDCNMEFPTRIDYDTHLLSPEHMMKSFNTRKPEKRKNQLTILVEEDELKDLKEEKEKKEKVEGAEGVEGETEGDGAAAPAVEGAEANGENGTTVKGEENANPDENGENAAEKETVVEVKPEPEPEDIILDFKEGDVIPTEVETKIPRYNCNRKIAESMIHKLECWECQLCGRYFDSEKTSEVHSRTVTHHRNFVKFLNEKSNDTKIAQKRAAAAQEEIERKKRKLNTDEPAANGTTEESTELYDPTEATEEEEDVPAELTGDITMTSVTNDQSLNETVESANGENLLPPDGPIEGTVTTLEAEPATPVAVNQQQQVTPQSQNQNRNQKTPQSNQSTPNQRKQNARGGRGGYRGRGRNKNRY